MKTIRGRKRRLVLIANKLVAVITLFFFSAGYVFALPAGQQVVNGQASFITQGNKLTITNSPNSIINWQGFSISNNEAVRFIQQNGASAVLNRVIGQDPSLILGLLQSNGRVFLINPNGMLFGQGARIDVNGLFASTLNIGNQDFLAGKYNFNAGTVAGAIQNQGTITTPAGGKVYLIAPDIENSGIINSPQGEVLLAAGHSVQLVDSLDPDIAVVVSAPENKAVNLGQIVAQSGKVGIYGGLIRQAGIVNADSAVVGENGRIFFKAKQDINLAGGSTTSANGAQGGQIKIRSEAGTTMVAGAVTATGDDREGGDIQILGQRVGLIDKATVDASGKMGNGTVLIGGDYRGQNASVQNAEAAFVGPEAIIRADAMVAGDGGKVIVWSDQATQVYGKISARGGALSGDGGFIETSGKYLDVTRAADASAPNGKAGAWLLDPYNVTVQSTPGILDMMTPPFTPYTDDSTISNYAINSALNLGMSVAINTGGPAGYGSQPGDITVNAPITASTGMPTTLTLTAHNNININQPITSTAALNLTLNHGGAGSATLANSLSLAGGNVNVGLYSAGVVTPGAGTLNITAGSTSLTGALATSNLGISGGTLNLNSGAATTVTTLDLSGGTLGGTDTLELTGTGTWSGGTLVGTGALKVGSLATLAMNGSTKILGTRTLTNDGTINWTAGEVGLGGNSTFANNGTFNIQGDLIWAGAGGASGYTTTLNNSGAINKSTTSGAAYLGNYSYVNLSNTGTVDVQSGTLRLYGNSTTPAGSTGVFQATSGNTLSFYGGIHDLGRTSGSSLVGDGTFAVTGATVNINNPVTLAAGSLSISSGTLNANAATTVSKLTLSGGTLGGTDTLELTGTGTWSGGTLVGTGALKVGSLATLAMNGSTKILGTRTLTNDGTINWTAGEVGLGGNSTFANNGTFNIQGDLIWAGAGGASGYTTTLNNSGAINKSTTSGAAYLGNYSYVNLSNTGTVDVQSGTLRLYGNSTTPAGSTGVFQATSGNTLSFYGGIHDLGRTSGSSLVGDGTFAVTGATVNINNPVTLAAGSLSISSGTLNANAATTVSKLTLSGGTLGGTDTLELTGTGTWSGGTLVGTGALKVGSLATLAMNGSTKILGTRTLTNDGTINWTAGEVGLGGNSTFANNGTFNIQGDLIWAGAGGASGYTTTLNNSGAINKSTTSGAAYLGNYSYVNLSNTGTVDVQSGTLRLYGNSTTPAGSTGVFQATSGNTLSFYGGIHDLGRTSGSSLVGDGTFAVTGATVNINNPVTLAAGSLSISSGTLNANAATTVSKLTLSGGTLGGTDTLELTGTGTWSGGTLVGTGALKVGSLATLAMNGSTKILGTRTLTNDGTINWTAGEVGLGGNSTFANNGTFNIQGDLIWAGAGGASGYTTTLNNSGAINKSTTSGAAYLGNYSYVNLSNAGTVDVQSGLIDINGAISTPGAIEVASGATFKKTGGFTNAGMIGGLGTINVGTGNTLTSTGTLRPGAASGTTTGTLSITGNLNNSGDVNIELGGTPAGQYDVIAVSGTTTLGGTLNVSEVNGFLTRKNNSFSVLTAGTRSGAFSTNNYPADVPFTASGSGNLTLTAGSVTTRWNTDSSGDWATAANWSRGLPTSTDKAVISRPLADPTITISSGSQTVSGIVCDDALSITTGGGLTINGSSTIHNLALSGGTLAGSGTVNLTGSSTWSGGTIGVGGSGGVTIGSGNTLTLSGGNKTIDGGKLTIAGEADWTDGDVLLRGGSQITVQSGGLFDIRTDADMHHVYSTVSTLTNAGTLRKSLGADVTILGASNPFNIVNSGTVDAQTGILNFAGINTFNNGSAFTSTGAGTGKSQVTTGATLNGTITSSNSKLELAGGLFTGTASLSGVTAWSGGTIGGGAVYTIPVGSTLRMTNSGDVTLDGASLIAAGTIALTGGDLLLRSGSQIAVPSGGLFDIQTDADLHQIYSTASTLTNAGTLRKSGGTDVTILGASNPFNIVNSGAVDAQTGMLSFAGYNTFTTGSTFTSTGVGTGKSQVTTGATLSGTISSSDSRLELAAGFFTGTASLSGVTAWSGGTIGGGAAYTIPVGSTLRMTNSGDVTLDGASLIAAGTIALTGGNLLLKSGSQITIPSGGLFDIQTDGDLNQIYSTASTLTNAGTLRKSGGTDVTILGGSNPINVNNSGGTIDVTSGSLQLNAAASFSAASAITGGTVQLTSGGGSITGTVAIGAGATLDFAGGTTGFTGATGFTGSGTLLLSGATLNGGGTVNVGAPMTWSGGTIGVGGSGGVTIGSGNTLTLSGGNKTIDGGKLTIAGEADWTDGNVLLRSGSQITVPSGGLFDIRTDADLHQVYSTASTLTNAGTLRKSGGTDVTILGATNPFNIVNSGTVDAQTGMLNFAGNNTFNTGSTFTSTGVGTGKSQVTTGAALSGTISSSDSRLELAAGFFTGTASLSGVTAWSGGTIGGGAAYTIPVGSTLRMTNSGDVTLDGASLIAAGTIALTGGNLLLKSGSQITIPSGGLFDIQTDGDLNQIYSTASTLTNAGTLRKSGGTDVTILGGSNPINVNNSGGTIDVTSGSLQLNAAASFSAASAITGGTVQLTSGGGSITGTVAIGAGATLDFAGGTTGFTGATGFTGSGTLLLSGATLNGGGTVNVGAPMTWSGGTIGVGGSGGVTIGSGNTLTLSGGNKTIDGGKLTIAGEADWTDGNVLLRSGSQITVPSGGLFDIRTDADLHQVYSTASTLTNAGTLRKSGGTDVTILGATNPFNIVNSGTVDAQTGMLNFAGNNTFNTGSTFTSTGVGTGKSQVTTGAALSGTISSSDSRLELAAGFFTGTASLSGVTAWSGGTIGGGAAYTIPVGSTLRMTNSGDVTLDGASLIAAGTIALTGGNLLLKSGSQITIPSGGLFDIQTDGDLNQIYSTASTLTNAGTLRKSGGTDVSILGGSNPITVNNSSGTIDVQSGTIDVPWSFSTTGAIEVASGTVFKRNGGFTNAGIIGGKGTINVGTGNTLTNSGTLRPGAGSGTTTGTLSVTGNYSQGTTGRLNVELGGTGAGQYDKLAVTGSVTMGGTLNASLVGGYAPVSGDYVPFLTMRATDTASGTFATTALPSGFNAGYSLASGEASRLIYSGTSAARTFTNASGGLTWETSGNWSGGALPISTDDALISAGFAVTHATGNDTVANLAINSGNSLNVSGGSLSVLGTTTLGGGLTVSGGSATLTGTLNGGATGQINISSGSLALNSTSSVAGMNLSGGTLQGSGSLTVSANFNQTGGTVGTGFQNLAFTNSGNLTVGPLTAANSLNLKSSGGNIVLNGTLTTSTGDITLAAANNFINNVGNTVFSPGGRWLVYSSNPASDIRGGLSYNFKQYNAIYGSTAVLGSGNGFLYTTAPTLTAQLIGTVQKTYDGTNSATLTAGNYLVSGMIDGDTVSLNNPVSGTYDSKNAGSGKTVTVTGISVNSVTNGPATVYGYMLPSGSATSNNGNIDPASLALSAVADTKTYDGTTASAGVVTSGGLKSGDSLSNLTQSFASKNVLGAGQSTLNVDTGYLLDDGNSGQNYTVTANTARGTITPASLALSAVADTKTYDGTTASAGVVTSGGLKSGDSLSNLSQSFASKNVLGTNNSTLNINAGYTLNDGNSGQNYTVTANTARGTITPASLALSAVADTKTYDGTTASAGVVTSGGLKSGDSLSNLSQSFASKNVLGTNNSTLNINAGYTLNDGNSGNNYTVTANAAKGTITPASLALSAVTDTKTYDGTTASTGIVAYGGLKSGDSLSNLSQSFASKNVLGTNNSTLNINAGYTLNDGNSGNNYTVTANAARGTVNPYAVSLTGSRTYNGSADVAAGIFAWGPLVGSETLTLAGAGTVADKNAAAGKTVNVSGLSLGDGSGLASNYTFIGGTQTADITPRLLSITAAGVNKVYDGLTGATVTLADNRIVGDLLITGYTAAFPDKNVGTGKTVNVSGINLTGTDAGNYSLTDTTAATTADITPRSLTITATGMNKVYDGLTGATVTLADNRIAGDFLSTGYAGAAYLDRNVGTGKAVNVSGINLTGTDAGNYSLTNTAAAATADITARALTVAAATNTKGYDGKTNAAATPSIASGSLAGSDTATLTEVYDSKTAGTGKTLIPAAVISDGNGGNNYLVTYVNTTSGVIEPGQIVSGLLDVAAGGKTIDFVVNGTLLTDQAATDASGNYSLMLPLNSVPNNSALLAYVANDASLKSASVYLSTGGDITNLSLSSNTVTAGGGGTMSNTTFGVAKGTLSSSDIPYSVSGTNLTLSPNFGFKTAGGTAYSINGNITTTNGAHSYNGPVTLLANAVLTASTGNISFGGPVTGTGYNFTLNSQGTVTQTAPIAVSGLELVGTGGTYNLTNTANAIKTLAGNTGTVNFTNNSGIDIGTVNTAGLTTSGNLTLNSGGAVTQSAPLQVAGSAALGAGATHDITLMNAGNNFGSVGITSGKDVSLRNAGALALNVSTVSNSLSATAGGDITLKGLVSAGAGEVTLKSSGAVINGLGGATSISAGALSAEAANGIGSGDPLMTAVNRLAALNTTANNIEIDNTGVLTVSDLRNLGTGNVVLQNIGAITTGTSTVTASVGTVSITAHSPLTIGSGGVSASGDISLEASPSDGSDNLTINGNIASSNGNIVLKAGSSIVYNPGSDLNAPHGTITLADVNGTSAATPSTVATGNTTATNNTVAALKTSEGTTIAKVETTSDSDKKKEDEERKKKEESGEKKTDDKKTGDNTKNYCN